LHHAQFKKVLGPAPTGISPAANAKQKQNEKSDQKSFHRSTSFAMLRKMKTDICSHRDTIKSSLVISGVEVGCHFFLARSELFISEQFGK